MKVEKKCARMSKQLEKSQLQLKTYEDFKAVSLSTQAKALDAIQLIRPQIEDLEHRVSECSVQYHRQIAANKDVIERYKALNDESTAMLSEMNIDFERIRQLCAENERPRAKSSFTKSVVRPTATKIIGARSMSQERKELTHKQTKSTNQHAHNK